LFCVVRLAYKRIWTLPLFIVFIGTLQRLSQPFVVPRGSEEVPRGEGEGHADGLVPVFPVVLAVADAELALDVFLAHELVELDAEVEEEVVVAAVDEPLHRAQLRDGGLVGLAHVVDGREVAHRLLDEVDLVVLARLALLAAVVVEPGAHGVDG